MTDIRTVSPSLPTRRILIYTHHFPPFGSGAGTYAYNIAREFARLDQEVMILTARCEEAAARSRLQSPFKLLEMPAAQGNIGRLVGLGFLGYSLLRFQPHCLFVVEKTAQEVCSVAQIFWPLPRYSVTVYGTEVLLSNRSRGQVLGRMKAILFHRLWERAEHIITISKYTRDLLREVELDNGRIVVLPCGVDSVRFRRASSLHTLRRSLEIRDEESVLLTLGVLKPRKGQDMVLQALPMVLEQVPSVRYTIAGRGEDKVRLEGLVEELSLQQHVLFAGFVPKGQLLDYYDLCDVFVMPSRREGDYVEGFGIPFLEANARGKPVIGGRHGGVPEVVVHGETGLLVDPHDPRDIAEAIIRLLTDRELALRLGENGRRRSFASFGWEKIAQQTLELLIG